MKNSRNKCSREKAEGARSRYIVQCAMVLTAAMFAVTCKSVTLTDVGELHKGMNAEESKAALPVPPKYEFSLDSIDGNGPFLVDIYLLVSGDYSSKYILAFSDSKLLYWGYPHEFARSRDSLINSIGEQSVKKLNELEDAEKLAREQQDKKKH